MAVYRLKNRIQHYPWGSKELLPRLMGIENPDGKPYAELWMGAHPKAPSRIESDGDERSLIDLIDEDPARYLGEKTAADFGALPFLFKLLAAGEPLSIQAHPTKAQAEEGFARENRTGPAVDAPDRNYRDDNHKPEIMVALTPFWALRGFRPWEEIEKLAGELGAVEYLRLVEESGGDLKRFFASLMEHPDPAACSAEIVAAAAEKSGDLYRWIEKLNDYYPGDIGTAAPLYLNLVQLQPGEALFLAAGELHAYLEGLGVELMANSDNVLRGGLTVKHVDIPELLRTLSFSGAKPEIIRGEASGPVLRYASPAPEFSLFRIGLAKGEEYRGESDERPLILVCTEGNPLVEGEFRLKPGESLFISAHNGAYSIEGPGTIFAATVPEA